jgi:uncharacterized protein (DUF2062 family)
MNFPLITLIPVILIAGNLVISSITVLISGNLVFVSLWNILISVGF